MNIKIFIYMCACIHTQTCTRIRTRMHARVHMYLCICGSICKHEYTYRILVYKPITYMHTPAAAKKEFDASAARMCSPLRVHINQFD